MIRAPKQTSPEIKLLSRLRRLLVIRPSKFVYRGLSAHNAAIKQKLLSTVSKPEFYSNFLREWKSFRKGLKWLGSKVITAEALGGKSCPDCTFAQDLALVLHGPDEVILISPKKMGAKARRKESGRLRKLFGKKVRILILPGTIDFGDVISVEIDGKKALLIGKRNNDAYEAAVGSTQKIRTSDMAIEALTTVANDLGYKVVEITHSALHLTSAMTMAGQAKANDPIVFLHNEHILDKFKVKTHIARALEVPLKDICLIATHISRGTPEEKAKASWSASCLGHNGKVLVQKGSAVAKILRDMGFIVLEVPFDFIMSIDGGMTCLILELISLRPKRTNWKAKKKPKNNSKGKAKNKKQLSSKKKKGSSRRRSRALAS